MMEGEKVWGVKISGQVDFDLCFIYYGVSDLVISSYVVFLTCMLESLNTLTILQVSIITK
jgi:hypothetical protein